MFIEKLNGFTDTDIVIKDGGVYLLCYDTGLLNKFNKESSDFLRAVNLYKITMMELLKGD